MCNNRKEIHDNKEKKGNQNMVKRTIGKIQSRKLREKERAKEPRLPLIRRGK